MSAQAIKYQTTTIDADQSAGEIGRLVVKYGGTRFEMRWGTDGMLTGIRFAIRSEGLGEVPVRLEARTDTIREILEEAKPFTYRTRSTRAQYEEDIHLQAHRIAWRQLRDFVEQALLAVETGLFPIGAAFMANLEMWDEEAGETVTMGELLQRRGQLQPAERGIQLLPAGKRLP